MKRPLLFLLAILALFGVCRAFAGGWDSPDVPTLNVRCNPIIEPSDVPKQKGKQGWKRLKMNDRLKIYSDSRNEVQRWEVLSCREYDKDNHPVRDFVVAEEWYR